MSRLRALLAAFRHVWGVASFAALLVAWVACSGSGNGAKIVAEVSADVDCWNRIGVAIRSTPDCPAAVAAVRVVAQTYPACAANRDIADGLKCRGKDGGAE